MNCTMFCAPHRGPQRFLFLERCRRPATRTHPITDAPICAAHLRELVGRITRIRAIARSGPA